MSAGLLRRRSYAEHVGPQVVARDAATCYPLDVTASLDRYPVSLSPTADRRTTQLQFGRECVLRFENVDRAVEGFDAHGQYLAHS